MTGLLMMTQMLRGLCTKQFFGLEHRTTMQTEAVMRLASVSGQAGMGFGVQAIDEDRYFRLDLAIDILDNPYYHDE